MPRVSVLGLMMAGIAVACGAPPLAAAEYFPAVEHELSRLDLATRDLTDRFATELEAELDSLVADVDLSVPGAQDLVLEEIMSVSRIMMQAIIESHTGQVEVLAERIGELVPPDVVASAHAEFVGAFTSWADSGNATVALLQEASDLAGLADVLTASPYADAQMRVDQACRALNERAGTLDINLTCPGTQLEVLETGA